ncbi:MULTISPECIES: phthiocerol/phthiodiolone dimycocerosyl transferase [Mycobacterium ulcerans group]|uniref:Phthiocerol/phthiodiolone dimycocerosyl transferase n=3 Tax=Mycobacterium ulcerans group TaxID=2993898 RepID=B2HIM3_MYCMM|nr:MULTISPECIES: phthiocerol/phthiodiolone dimycocerosyl transferase [Mycobacterium ulcerans group]ACC40217.1 conserved polyketide synthase associated protein PapA5 [Mycobacterium marinum M]AGC61834.1 polyketide synthase associated protein PapA5 [Mycobacterium liflandii 128FXT]EPQ75527.1 putative conseved polyketide synthase associated protein [Mycobacterium marinum MB2]MDC8972799.1 phthiocerol/phthiodiolone dimycocerosyl transferase [Mycobacterium marinum]MDC8982672.1 phthiocerol/phthiodiolon
MFPGAVIRKLAFSEEIYARYQAFTSFTAHVRGPVDIDAMSEAFDALLQAHPVFAAHLEEGPDGNHHIVANDLLHSGLVVIDGRRAENPHVQLDQRDSLFRLQLTLGESENLVTAYVHHSLADAHHLGSLLDELLSRYTDVVTTGDPGPITPEPAPQPAEDLLKRRGIKQSALTGFERFLPLLFAYDLPPIAEEMRKFEAPEPVPVTRCRLTSQETADLVSFSRDNGLSFNAVLAAAILLAEWRLRETPHVPIPYCYAVDLRFLLSPPVGATESTNPVGLATYLAEIGPDTDITELAADIVATFRADLSDGMIHQSALRSGRILEGTPPGLPPFVLCTNVSTLPPIRTPEDVELVDFHSRIHCAMDVPFGFYACSIATDRLSIELHGSIPAPQLLLDAIRDILCSVPSEYGLFME